MSTPHDDMALPAGKTCGDCAGWLRCKAFIGSLKPTNTRCDWAPSAFREKAARSVQAPSHMARQDEKGVSE